MQGADGGQEQSRSSHCPLIQTSPALQGCCSRTQCAESVEEVGLCTVGGDTVAVRVACAAVKPQALLTQVRSAFAAGGHFVSTPAAAVVIGSVVKSVTHSDVELLSSARVQHVPGWEKQLCHDGCTGSTSLLDSELSLPSSRQRLRWWGHGSGSLARGQRARRNKGHQADERTSPAEHLQGVPPMRRRRRRRQRWIVTRRRTSIATRDDSRDRGAVQDIISPLRNGFETLPQCHAGASAVHDCHTAMRAPGATRRRRAPGRKPWSS